MLGFRMDEVVPKIMFNIDDSVYPEAIDSNILNPVAVAVSQRFPHGWILSVEIVKIEQLVGETLLFVLEIIDAGRPMVDRRLLLVWIGHIVLIEGLLARGGNGHGLRIIANVLGWIGRIVVSPAVVILVGEEITGVIGYDILDYVHAPVMQGN